MHRGTCLFAGLLLGLTPILLGQDPKVRPVPAPSRDVIATQQLIAWSRMQNPQPVPQPLPPPDNHPDPQPAPPANPHAEQQSPTQTFTGKIVRDGEKYILRVSTNTTCQLDLDQQNNAKQYENRDVKIVGTLDTGRYTIRVVKIELLS